MNDPVLFPDRQSFREWLSERGETSEGVWLLFGKKGGPKTLTADEALSEALCFGWIDGQMESIDETRYRKYFAHRTAKSRWSDKNKKTVQTLIEKGLMAAPGLEAIQQAQANGMWDAPGRVVITDEQVQAFRELVRPHEPAFTNLSAMSPSVQRTYTGYYLDTKSEKTRADRLLKIIGRLDKNLKPM